MSGTRAVGRGLVAASFGLSAALYTRLPDAFPIHFGVTGRADRFLAKPLGPFALPLIGLVGYAIVAAVVRRQRSAALHVVPTAFAALFFAIHAAAVRTALDDTTDVTRWLLISISLFITVLGNYLGKLRRNRWIGIRTPWTLADDEVWMRTHRLGGWMFVAGGALGVLAALSGAGFAVVLGVLVISALIPAAASYVIFRRVVADAPTRRS